MSLPVSSFVLFVPRRPGKQVCDCCVHWLWLWRPLALVLALPLLAARPQHRIKSPSHRARFCIAQYPACRADEVPQTLLTCRESHDYPMPAGLSRLARALPDLILDLPRKQTILLQAHPSNLPLSLGGRM